jgi:hypothetical protein
MARKTKDTLSAEVRALVNHVKAYATERYTKGWDVVIETMTDEEIAAQIEGAKTTAGAVRKMAATVKLLTEAKAEAALETAATRDLVYGLTTQGVWDVHAAGCADLKKAATRRKLQLETMTPFSAATEAEVIAVVIDSETADLGYDASHVTIYPCCNVTKGKRGPAELSTEQESTPDDPAALRKLIKITRDRRWRAGRRGDDALAGRMSARLDILVSELAAMTASK